MNKGPAARNAAGRGTGNWRFRCTESLPLGSGRLLGSFSITPFALLTFALFIAALATGSALVLFLLTIALGGAIYLFFRPEPSEVVRRARSSGAFALAGVIDVGLFIAALTSGAPVVTLLLTLALGGSLVALFRRR